MGSRCGNEKSSFSFIRSTATLRSPVLSPDGRWLAYVSDESGINQLYVRPYPALDRKWQISQNGILTQSNFFALAATTYLPHWRPDGRELLFISLNGTIDTVSIETKDGNFSATEAKTLLKPTIPFDCYRSVSGSYKISRSNCARRCNFRTDPCCPCLHCLQLASHHTEKATQLVNL